MSAAVIITGSSGVLGVALVNRFREVGYFVIGLDKIIFEDGAPIPHKFIKADLFKVASDELYREEIVIKIKRSLPDAIKKLVLVNNAAVQITKPIKKFQWGDFEMSLAVNAAAPFFLTQSLTELLAQLSGHVINISSIHAKLTKPHFALYAVSKSALDAVTRSLAVEISGLGIAINSVAPAAINTDMLKEGFNNNSEKLEKLKNFHPSNCIGEASEVAEVVKLIAEQGGRFMTGSIVEVNGGISSRLHDPG